MGAICGFIDSNKNLTSVEDLKGMSQTLSHRGHHHENLYYDNGIGFAFRALKSEIFYDQNILENDDDNFLFAVDGEPLNQFELHNFREKTNFKFLGELYKKYDINFIEKLNGPFSIALFDRSKNRLILARDRSGQKPLYFTQSNGLFVFASELKALTYLPYIDKKLDLKSLYWYLAGGYICSPRSIFEKIYKLPEGTILIYNLTDQSLKQIKYDNRHKISIYEDTIPEENLVDKLDELLTTLFEEQVSRLSEPIGCFLSGGIDTSLVLAFLKKVTTKEIKTFTVGFADPVCDERPYAQKIANYLNVDNYDYEISEHDFIDISHHIIDYFDEPFADIGTGTVFQAAKLARQYTDVAFSGDGADFLFGNYDLKYLYLFYKIFPAFLRKPIVSTFDFIFNTSLMQKKFPNMPIKSYLGEDNFFDALFIKWKKNELTKLLGIDVDTHEGKYYKVFTDSKGNALSNRILEAQFKTYGIDGVDTKSERTNMANSLNVINPFLDNRIIDFANSLPLNLKFKKGYGKYLNRRLLYRYIPKEFFDRPKRGSGIPFGNLTDKGMKLLANQYLTPERLKKEGIFKDIGIIEKAIHSYLAGDYFIGHKLWTLIIFEIWLERNL